MGGAVAKVVFKSGKDKFDIDKYESLNDIEVTTLEEEKKTMGDVVAGKKLYLIVNTASK